MPTNTPSQTRAISTPRTAGPRFSFDTRSGLPGKAPLPASVKMAPQQTVESSEAGVRNGSEGRSSQGRRPQREQPAFLEGLLLMNQTMERMVLDRGAVAILNVQTPPGAKMDPASCVPTPVLDLIRRNVHELRQVTMYFPIGEQSYVWRAYWVDAQNGFIREPMIGLHVEKVVTDRDPIFEVAARYKLTEREREALCGISMGLASKDVAQLMGISPNTVKAFVRMIMIKMGVTNRNGIVANLLQSATYGEQHTPPKKPVAKEEDEGMESREREVVGRKA